MTDTPRTLTAILGLFPDNTAGDISPQDLRDFVVSCVEWNTPAYRRQIDIDALKAAAWGLMVSAGCAVTAQATPNMTVNVAAGGISGPTGQAVTGGNLTITTADATYPRIDLVVVSSAGAKSVVAGTPADQPVAPALPAGSVPLATVYVPAGDTAIESSQITDKRIFSDVATRPLKRLWIDAAGFLSYEGSPSLLTTAHYIYWALDKASLEGIMGQIEVPSDWDGDECLLAIQLANLSGASGNVRLNLKYKLASFSGTLIGGTSWNTISATTAPDSHTNYYTEPNIGDLKDLTPSAQAGNKMVVCIERDGAHAQDTYDGDIAILGFALEYTAKH